MLKRFLLVILTISLFCLSTVSPVSAQTYLFNTDREEVVVTVNEDGTVTVSYLYVFRNDPSADPMEYVDVGVPTNAYSLSNVSADLDGVPVSSIEESPYVQPGVAIGLGSRAIPPGQTGTLRVTITGIRDMLYVTNKVEDVSVPYASFQFSPNSFGSEFVLGTTDVTVTLVLPPGMNPEDPRWFTPQSWPGDDTPQSGIDEQGRVFYRWQSNSANVATQYIFGAAFPQSIVPNAALVTEPVFTSNQLENLCPMLFCVGMVGFIVLMMWAAIVGSRKRQLQYLPPKIAVEGNGIKRGLTAVEAAILMETPMEKILSMILFAVVKKGAAEVTSRDPLRIKSLSAPTGVEVRSYEAEFIGAMVTEDGQTRRKMLQTMMIGLVKEVSEKMRGFSRRETVEYYRDIMAKAWEQVEAADTPEVKMQRFDDNMDWTMLDRRFEDRSRDVFGRGPVYVPMWWGRYDPVYRGSTGPSIPTGPTQVGQAPGKSSLPSLPGADFAASMAGGVQAFSSNVVGNITNFTSDITNKTNPVPKTTSSGRSSGGGGGGRSCACACACAGCACACAGGGR
ncbi:MAG: hypothetical protein HY835_05715 [Anaerolineae bacterium]|nr:hypothetical protein [Anaerolineae bacterium]